MINIGLLVYDISLTGGAEKVALNLAREFSNKYNVFMISVFNQKKYKAYDRFQLFSLSNNLVKIPFNIRKLSKKLKKYLLDNEIDVLLSITAGVNDIAVLGTRKINTKLIYCEHSNLENKTYGLKHRFRQMIGAKKADLIVTLTERDKENFLKKYNLNEQKVVAIPNWYTPIKQNDQYKDNSKKIITVGRLEKVKGYDLLVKVAQKVLSKYPDWSWDIYGEGTCRKDIEKNICENNLEGRVILKGNVNNLSELYNDYSFFVMTSYYEGFPLALLEAQSFNLPIISFNCPTGPEEIIANNKNGIIVPAYNIDEMVKKIIYLIENKNVRIKFSKNAQNGLTKFSLSGILSIWYQEIDKLVKEK